MIQEHEGALSFSKSKLTDGEFIDPPPQGRGLRVPSETFRDRV